MQLRYIEYYGCIADNLCYTNSFGFSSEKNCLPTIILHFLNICVVFLHLMGCVSWISTCILKNLYFLTNKC